MASTTQQMRCFERPTESEIRSVRTFINNKQHTVESENGWFFSSKDQVALRPPKEPDWLERLIGKVSVIKLIGPYIVILI